MPFTSHLKSPGIVTALSQNYMFASLKTKDLDELSSKMEIIRVAKGEDIITQGNMSFHTRERERE